MSQVPNPYEHEAPGEQGPKPSNGLAIASLVLGIVGIVPLLGVITSLVGLILGIIALAKAKDKKGMAVAGTTVSACMLVFSCVLSASGILLPALGKARAAARQIKSSSQMRLIAQGLILYANDNKDAFPEPGADWEARLVSAGLISRELLAAPQAQPGDLSYFYVPGGASTLKHDKVLLIENPEFYQGRGGNVAFEDSTVEYLVGDDFWNAVEKAKASGAAVPFVRRR
jgi:hypothetical protein